MRAAPARRQGAQRPRERCARTLNTFQRPAQLLQPGLLPNYVGVEGCAIHAARPSFISNFHFQIAYTTG